MYTSFRNTTRQIVRKFLVFTSYYVEIGLRKIIVIKMFTSRNCINSNKRIYYYAEAEITKSNEIYKAVTVNLLKFA